MNNNLKYSFDIYFKNGKYLSFSNNDYDSAVKEITELFISFKNRSMHIMKCTTKTDVIDMNEVYKISFYPEPINESEKEKLAKEIRETATTLHNDVTSNLKNRTSKFYNKLNGDEDSVHIADFGIPFSKTIPEECLQCKMLYKCQEKNIKMCE